MERLGARNNIYSDICRELLGKVYRSENPSGIRQKISNTEKIVMKVGQVRKIERDRHRIVLRCSYRFSVSKL